MKWLNVVFPLFFPHLLRESFLFAVSGKTWGAESIMGSEGKRPSFAHDSS